jgi:hypothetical protein
MKPIFEQEKDSLGENIIERNFIDTSKETTNQLM